MFLRLDHSHLKEEQRLHLNPLLETHLNGPDLHFEGTRFPWCSEALSAHAWKAKAARPEGWGRAPPSMDQGRSEGRLMYEEITKWKKVYIAMDLKAIWEMSDKTSKVNPDEVDSNEGK